MKTGFHSIVVCFLIFFHCLMATEQTPSWVKNPLPGIYVGVSRVMKSEQEARNNAVKDAKRQIIANLGGLVETEFVDRLVESSEEGNFAYTDSKVKIIAKTILAIETQDFFIKEIIEKTGFMQKETKYQAYAKVHFSKSKHDQFLKELVAETTESTRQKLQELREIAESGQVIYALSELEKLPEEYQKVMTLTGLSPTQISRLKKLDQKINLLIGNIRGNLYMETSRQKYLAKINRKIDDPLTVKLFWQNRERQIPLQGIPVAWEEKPEMMVANAIPMTNESGTATCRIHKILTPKQFSLRVNTEFPDSLNLDNLNSTFLFIPDNKISIHVIETINNGNEQNPFLENLLVQKFSQKDFKIINDQFVADIKNGSLQDMAADDFQELIMNSDMDFMILGTISIDRTNQYMEDMHFAWAKAVVKLYDVSNNQIIASIIHEAKGAGNSDRAAGVKAIQKAGEEISRQLINQILNEGNID
ncbi:MAG: hypothetical protein ACLFQM_09865 [Fidelibacterota bacterium]